MPNAVPIMTWRDAIEHCRDFVAGGADAYNENHFYAATQAALRELTRSCTWNYYWTHGWINMEAVYDTGTVAYDHTGGAYERMLTLTSGTWPTNAIYGQVRIDDVIYKVEDRKSSTIITLTADSNPGADVAASTSYQWFRSEYTLPVDWRKTTMPSPKSWGGMCYVEPEEFYIRERAGFATGTPYLYTITSDSNLYGSMAIRIYPAPSEAKTLAFMYQRWPRALKISGEATGDYAGTVTTDGTTTITGSSTSFASKHVGSIIRFYSDSTQIPTGFNGRYPPEDERVITAYSSATSITVDAAVSTLSGVKYVISDPVDLNSGMFEAYLRNVEKQLATRQRDYEVLSSIQAAWLQELEVAIGNDHAFAGAATSGENYGFPWWFQPMRAPIELRMGD